MTPADRMAIVALVDDAPPLAPSQVALLRAAGAPTRRRPRATTPEDVAQNCTVPYSREEAGDGERTAAS